MKTFYPHSCLFGREVKDRSNYPPELAARVLLKHTINLESFSQDKVLTILKPYFYRPPKYYSILVIRRKFEELLYGEEEKRAQLLPDIVKRISSAGHFCDFKMINGFQMRKLAIKKAEADFN